MDGLDRQLSRALSAASTTRDVSIAAGSLALLPAVLRRIHVEEAELVSVLGDRYRAYQAQTRRLIPGIW